MTFLVKVYPRTLNAAEDDKFIPVSNIRSKKIKVTVKGAKSERAGKQQVVRDLLSKGLFVKKIQLQETMA